MQQQDKSLESGAGDGEGREGGGMTFAEGLGGDAWGPF